MKGGVSRPRSEAVLFRLIAECKLKNDRRPWRPFFNVQFALGNLQSYPAYLRFISITTFSSFIQKRRAPCDTCERRPGSF